MLYEVITYHRFPSDRLPVNLSIAQLQHHVGQVADGIIVGRVADIVDFAGGDAILVFDDT